MGVCNRSVKCEMPLARLMALRQQSPSRAQEKSHSMSFSEQHPPLSPTAPLSPTDNQPSDGDYALLRLLVNFSLTSVRGQERVAIQQVTQAVASLNLSTKRLKRLQTAVAEATMNAMEHGNRYQADAPVAIQVLMTDTALVVRITDEGQTPFLLQATAPDLAAKLEGRQTGRGWGLFLIRNMVDEVHLRQDAGRHSVELVMYLHEEGSDVPRTI